jgi:hypothetical protein
MGMMMLYDDLLSPTSEKDRSTQKIKRNFAGFVFRLNNFSCRNPKTNCYLIMRIRNFIYKITSYPTNSCLSDNSTILLRERERERERERGNQAVTRA